MIDRIELPFVNYDHASKIRDKVIEEGWEEFNSLKLSFYKEELQEAFDNMNEGQGDDWYFNHTPTFDDIEDWIKSRFEDHDVWEVQIDLSNHKDYNGARNNVCFDVAWEIAESLCVYLGVPRHGEEEETDAD